MAWDLEYRPHRAAELEDSGRPRVAPGKSTRTSRLAPSTASIARAVAVQMRAAGVAVQRQLGGDRAAPLSNEEVAALLVALSRFDADVDLPRARAALEQFHAMNDRDTADVLKLLRDQGALDAVLDEQMSIPQRSQTLRRVDASLGVHFLILDGVHDAAVEAQAAWARQSFAEDGIALSVLSRTHDTHETSAQLLDTSGNPRSADVNGTNDDGTPADPGDEANKILERAHAASAGSRRDQGEEAHAVFVPALTEGRGCTVRPGWYHTAFPGVFIEAAAGTSTLAHELGHLCGLDHHPVDEGLPQPDDASTRTMYRTEGNRGSEWSPEEVETIKRSVYVRLTPRVVEREEGPFSDQPAPLSPGRALGDPVQRREGAASGDDDDAAPTSLRRSA